jgi:hypothetical protein
VFRLAAQISTSLFVVSVGLSPFHAVLWRRALVQLRRKVSALLIGKFSFESHQAFILGMWGCDFEPPRGVTPPPTATPYIITSFPFHLGSRTYIVVDFWRLSNRVCISPRSGFATPLPMIKGFNRYGIPGLLFNGAVHRPGYVEQTGIQEKI